MSVGKIRAWLKRLTARFPESDKVTVLRRALAKRASAVTDANAPPIAVQCLEDPFYFGLLAAICLQMRALTGATGELVVVRSISASVGNQWRNRLARSSLLISILALQWIRAFRGVADRVAYRSVSLAHPLRDLLDWSLSRSLWRRARVMSDFSTLRILGVPVGDLIIDSYLRFRPSPRFEASDAFVARLMWQAHRDVRRARAYFRSRKPRLYLTSYSTYIEHGIAVRVALQEGVPVRSFGSFTQFGKALTPADWFHTPNTSAYRTLFRSLDGQERRLLQAERQLSSRLAGQVDIATSYMQVSAYAPAYEPVPDVAGATVLFLHDFYDSAHCYDGLVFQDFWDWTCFSIDVLMGSGRKFFVKPHPNHIALSDEVMTELCAKYPRLPLLSPRVTNVQLAQQGMLCGVTVYGTVSHELAFLEVPSIACAQHPHHAFDFCRTATTVEQYRQFLLTAEYRPISNHEMRRQALEFFYMHNLHRDTDALSLCSTYAEFWKACHTVNIDSALMLERFEELLGSEALQSYSLKVLET